MKYSLSFSALAALLTGVTAHTWVEQLMNIDANGSYYGAAGYIRHYVNRDQQGFTDTQLTWLSPQNPVGGGRTRIDDTDMLCHPNQQAPNNSTDYPNLVTTAGNNIAVRYLENGHVSLPLNQIGKVPGAGLVYVYGTTAPKQGEKLANVLQWNANGTLEDGRLLTVNVYDDGRCYQVDAQSNISIARQAEFPNLVNDQPHELWCQNNVQIPQDATGTMTMYWVWQWPTQPNIDVNMPAGKDEIYTSCMDINIVGNQGALKAAVSGMSLSGFEDPTAPQKDYLARVANTTLPENPVFYNPGSPIAAAVSSSAGQAPAEPTPQVPAASTMVTSAAAAVSPFVSQPGVVYVTSTSIEVITTTITVDAPAATGIPSKRSAKFRG